jgi:hypothetical protein
LRTRKDYHYNDCLIEPTLDCSWSVEFVEEGGKITLHELPTFGVSVLVYGNDNLFQFKLQGEKSQKVVQETIVSLS